MTATPARHNAIIAELHAVRKRLAERFHNDLTLYSQAAEEHTRALGFKTIAAPTQNMLRSLSDAENEPPREA